MTLYDDLANAVRADRAVALTTVINGDLRGAKLLTWLDAAPIGSLGNPDIDRVVNRDAQGELAAGSSRVRHYGAHGEARQSEVSVFIESFVPAPRMVIFGAVDFTAALVRVAKVLGYHVIVCDARQRFATSARFPLADEVVVDWPDRMLERVGSSLTARDAVCILTHDVKFDVPAISGSLQTAVGYIGAMGSRRTHDRRLQQLIGDGVGATALARVRSPIGLDIGARTPEETAVAVCAEIIAGRYGLAEVRPLSETVGPIHHRPTDRG